MTVILKLDSLTSYVNNTTVQVTVPPVEAVHRPEPGVGVSDADVPAPYKGVAVADGVAYDLLCRVVPVPSGGGSAATGGAGTLYSSTLPQPVPFQLAGSVSSGVVSWKLVATPADAESKTGDSAPQLPPMAVECTLGDGGVLTGTCGVEGSEAKGLFALWPCDASTTVDYPHWLLSLLANLSTLFGRACGVLVQGPHVSFEEEKLQSVLASGVFGGGVESASTQAPPALGWQSAGSFSPDWHDALSAAVGLPTFDDPAPALPPTATADPATAFLQSLVDGGVSAGSRGRAVLDWLQAAVPESRMAARAAKFPDAELSLLCAIAKHTDGLGAWLGSPIACVP